MDDEHPARRLWRCYEPVHAVVYFAPEVLEGCARAGLKGFWMGYFAGRSAAFGEASPELVAATFFNFHDSLVRRALPDAWTFATPAQVLDARLDGVDAALQRLWGTDVISGPEVAEAADLAAEAADACTLDGRALFAAHAGLPWPDPPHLRLWHAATLLREHRGDGHVAANLGGGFGGLDAHLMLVGAGAVPRAMIQRARSWSDDDWDGAAERLRATGLLDVDGSLTDTGRHRREQVEQTTDELAWAPWQQLGALRRRRLEELLVPLAGAIARSDLIPVPNPMGLPAAPDLSSAHSSGAHPSGEAGDPAL